MHDLLVYLLSMVIMVPLSKRVGFGAVIGYLIAGSLIGPEGFSLLNGSESFTAQVADFGVIMMLLLIGLELSPKLLWKLRGPILGLGSIQVLLTSMVCMIGAMTFLDMDWRSALCVGMILSVSSTAVSLQSLQELGYSKSVGGERSFAVLLFQDVAVIPMLAILPLLGAHSAIENGQSLPALTRTFLTLGAVAAIIVSGRLMIRPLFKFISRMKLRETFTALALFIVAAAAALMHEVGVSPALGAFLAGVVLADSEYEHQIEADIEPFKGLLLGLFFMTVGSGLKLGLIWSEPLVVLGWVCAIVFGKSILTYALGRLVKLRPPESLLFSVSLAQGGEFAFVLVAQSTGLINEELSQILIASVALSMAISPILIKLTVRYGMSRLDCVKSEERLPDTVDESERDNPVLVVGIGRFGQTLIRFLRANGYASTVLDIDSEQIEIMAKFGIKSYFGDGSNLDLLRAAGLDRAKVLVLALDEPEITLKIVEMIRAYNPALPIYARAFDRVQAYKLLHLGVSEIVVETSGSALTLGKDVLQALGVSAERAESKGQLFEVNNRRSIRDLSKRFHLDDRETFIQASRQMSEQLEAMLKADPEELLRGASSDWSPPVGNPSHV